MEQKPHGGKRKNAGRKKGVTFKEPTIVYPVRINEALLNDLKKKFGICLPEIIREHLYKLNKSV